MTVSSAQPGRALPALLLTAGPALVICVFQPGSLFFRAFAAARTQPKHLTASCTSRRARPPARPPCGPTLPALPQVFVLHGGLFSKDDVSLDDLRQVHRNQ